MVKIVEKVFTQLAEDYLLNKEEAENTIDELKDELTGKLLKDMFASSNRERFAKNILESIVEEEVKKRKRVKIPSAIEMSKGLRQVLEELSEEVCLQ